jgi:hypothetical protein
MERGSDANSIDRFADLVQCGNDIAFAGIEIVRRALHSIRSDDGGGAAALLDELGPQHGPGYLIASLPSIRQVHVAVRGNEGEPILIQHCLQAALRPPGFEHLTACFVALVQR